MITPREVHQVAKEHGFWEGERNFGEALMLVVSELGEAIQAHRSGDWPHVQEEIADATIRLFDLAEGYGIDLETVMKHKHEKNKTRPYKHGRLY